jgi:hypothetical protein
MSRDPRSHRRYREARAEWLPRHLGDHCDLCRRPVLDLSTATVEHRLPVRTILLMARSYAEAVAMASDTTTWGIAHSPCQSRQGAAVTNGTAPRSTYRPSRDW